MQKRCTSFMKMTMIKIILPVVIFSALFYLTVIVHATSKSQDTPQITPRKQFL